VSILDVTDDAVLTTVPAGALPQNSVFTPDGSTIYIIASGDNAVLVMDANTYAISDTIPVGAFPIGAAITPDGSTLYVGDGAFGTNKVRVIGTATNTVLDSITVGDTPADLKITPDGSTLYVTNNGSSTVSVIGTASNTVIATITNAGASPNLMAMHPNGTELYVSGFDNFVAVVNTATNTVVASIPGIEFVLGFGITGDGSKLYALTPFSGTAIEANTATRSITTTFPMAFPNAIGNFINGVDLTAGIGHLAPTAIGVEAYPNPCIDRATLRFAQDVRGATVQVLDALGRTVRTAGNINGTQWTFERDGLTAGLYTVHISAPGERVQAVKLTVE
jgi:YVTN family beta-propeller protein